MSNSFESNDVYKIIFCLLVIAQFEPVTGSEFSSSRPLNFDLSRSNI